MVWDYDVWRHFGIKIAINFIELIILSVIEIEQTMDKQYRKKLITFFYQLLDDNAFRLLKTLKVEK